jgi:hypothetical protein
MLAKGAHWEAQVFGFPRKVWVAPGQIIGQLGYRRPEKYVD